MEGYNGHKYVDPYCSPYHEEYDGPHSHNNQGGSQYSHSAGPQDYYSERHWPYHDEAPQHYQEEARACPQQYESSVQYVRSHSSVGVQTDPGAYHDRLGSLERDLGQLRQENLYTTKLQHERYETTLALLQHAKQIMLSQSEIIRNQEQLILSLSSTNKPAGLRNESSNTAQVNAGSIQVDIETQCDGLYTDDSGREAEVALAAAAYNSTFSDRKSLVTSPSVDAVPVTLPHLNIHHPGELPGDQHYDGHTVSGSVRDCPLDMLNPCPLQPSRDQLLRQQPLLGVPLLDVQQQVLAGAADALLCPVSPPPGFGSPGSDNQCRPGQASSPWSGTLDPRRWRGWALDTG